MGSVVELNSPMMRSAIRFKVDLQNEYKSEIKVSED